MRASQWLLSTLRSIPNDAELISHQLMLRTGMIRKLASGLYTWMPLGLRVLHKIEKIVREEMERIHAIELLMPAVQPAELWQETGRWDTFGNQLLTMRDHNQRDYCFGPTHEEVVTDLMRNELQSYKQLPITVYQIQNKFRDEIRPRFGVMRAREFLMKDAYSFHLNLESLQETYADMISAYCKILERLQLRYRMVEADTGAIGGFASHEFQVLAASGEDIIVYSDGSDYAANIEQATYLLPLKLNNIVVDTPMMQIIDTINQKTIDDLVNYLDIAACHMVKTLIVEGVKDPLVALIVCGDDELNLIKAAKHPLVKHPLCFADEQLIKQTLNASVGSLGPVNLSIPLVVDYRTAAMPNFICGANCDDKHLINVVWGRDVACQDLWDLRNIQENDLSPDNLGNLHLCRGIEVGHVFQLGNKYSQAMHATVLDNNSKAQPLLMGCYGLGISRMVAAIIEQHHDENGIIWPRSIAPFTVVIIPINMQRCLAVKDVAEKLYADLINLDIEVLLDDRNERPGVLFTDHDLIGIPQRIVISERHLAQNCVEYLERNTNIKQIIAVNEIVNLF